MDNKTEINVIEQEQTNSESHAIIKKKRTVKPVRKFPNYSIEEILKVPTMIKENNGGNPWGTEQLAIALDVKRGGNVFYYMTAASRDYGFTIGTRETESIELTDLGRKYAYAQSQEQIESSKKTAFFNIEIFKKVYEFYNGSQPSDNTFFRNALFATFEYFGVKEPLYRKKRATFADK